MSQKSDIILVEGLVLKVLPNATFDVEIIEGGHKIKAYVSGKMRLNFVRLIPGDRVSVELNPYDLQRGRIVFRHKS